MERRFLLTLIAAFFTAFAFAQEQTNGNSVEMAEALRQDGKIYVVVVVLSLIFLGLILFLIVVDKRLRKLEKQLEK